MIIVLNERVLDALLDIGFHLIQDGRVGFYGDGSPKYGFKVRGPRYFTREQSKKIASSVMNDYSNVHFGSDYCVVFNGEKYDMNCLYNRSPYYLFFMQALRTHFMSLVLADPEWLEFVKEL